MLIHLEEVRMDKLIASLQGFLKPKYWSMLSVVAALLLGLIWNPEAVSSILDTLKGVTQNIAGMHEHANTIQTVVLAFVVWVGYKQ